MSIFTEKYCSELLEQQSSEKGIKLGEIILPDNEPLRMHGIIMVDMII